jgi:hypothetical protein
MGPAQQTAQEMLPIRLGFQMPAQLADCGCVFGMLEIAVEIKLILAGAQTSFTNILSATRLK